MKTFSNFFNFSLDAVQLDKASIQVINDIVAMYFPVDNTDVSKMSSLAHNKSQVVTFIVDNLTGPMHSSIAEQLMISLDSYNRPSILYKLNEHLDNDDWLRLFRGWWTQCDSCSLYHEEFKDIFGQYNIEDIREITHTDEDVEFYNSLPDSFEVYRGTFVDERFKPGISWTFDKSVAERFEKSYENFKDGGPMRIRYMVNLPQDIFEDMVDISKSGVEVLTRTVNKSDIFVITSRGEKEIIVLD